MICLALYGMRCYLGFNFHWWREWRLLCRCWRCRLWRLFAFNSRDMRCRRLLVAGKLVQNRERGAQAGGALHGVLLAVAFQVFGEAVDRFEVKPSVFADRAGFLGPVDDEEF